MIQRTVAIFLSSCPRSNYLEIWPSDFDIDDEMGDVD